MPMNDALQFIDRVRRDSDFRSQGYEADCPEHFAAWAEKSGYKFTSAEIDDAFRVLLLKAKDEESAEEIKELKQWYTLQATAR
jgi:predicted ribosomally synthesized peptide with nif11-like leader